MSTISPPDCESPDLLSVNPSLPLESRIHACWLGKSIGGTLGLPAEGKMGRLNFTFYDPIPTIAPPNDDLELQLVWLHLVENAGSSLTQEDFAKAWIDHIHYMWDEYGRTRWNLRRGVPVESAGTFENHFHAGMGSPIRSEIWACLFPGDSDSAAYYAALDASLDHGIEGIAGEVLFAVMQSALANGKSLEESLTLASRYIPGDCETARAIAFVRQAHHDDVPAWDCWQKFLERHGSENFTHAPLNVGLTIWALLYGGEDFEKSILLAANGGYDTDCTAATVGAMLGLLLGVEGIPARWVDPIGEGIFVGPGILGISAPKTLTELTERTLRLIGSLEPRKWDNAIWKQASPLVSLESLPGTIQLTPADGIAPVAWANGELPTDIKRSGGATWIWKVTDDEPREIVCLVQKGGRLFMNGQLIMECPAGLPYVPATHRCPDGSRIRVKPGPGTHEIRIDLNHCDPGQKASVLLTYPDLHIAPWSAEELPSKAELPAP